MRDDLKTLKELEYKTTELYIIDNNDIRTLLINEKIVLLEDLKKEAIKWIKEDKKVIERLHPDDVSTWTISMRGWMKRFNISEDDLKEISEEGRIF